MAHRFAIVLAASVLAATAAAVASPRAEASLTSCEAITVWIPGSGADRYDVRVEEGTTGCATARSVLRSYILDPSTDGPLGWICFRGHGSVSWAAACSRKGTLSVLRAYGPLPEQDLWRAAAARLVMPVLERAVLLGLGHLQLKTEAGLQCGGRYSEVNATFRRRDGASLYMIESRPKMCGDVGDATLLGHRTVHGKPGQLYRLSPAKYLLIWSERGIQIGLQSAGLSEADVLRIAQGTQPAQV